MAMKADSIIRKRLQSRIKAFVARKRAEMQKKLTREDLSAEDAKKIQERLETEIAMGVRRMRGK